MEEEARDSSGRLGFIASFRLDREAKDGPRLIGISLGA